MNMVNMVRYDFCIKNYHGYVEVDKDENAIVSAYLAKHISSTKNLVLVSWDIQNSRVGEFRLETTYRMARRWGHKKEYQITVDEYRDLYD